MNRGRIHDGSELGKAVQWAQDRARKLAVQGIVIGQTPHAQTREARASLLPGASVSYMLRLEPSNVVGRKFSTQMFDRGTVVKYFLARAARRPLPLTPRSFVER